MVVRLVALLRVGLEELGFVSSALVDFLPMLLSPLTAEDDRFSFVDVLADLLSRAVVEVDRREGVFFPSGSLDLLSTVRVTIEVDLLFLRPALSSSSLDFTLVDLVRVLTDEDLEDLGPSSSLDILSIF